MALDKNLLDVLACPKCKGDLAYKEAESVLDCKKCKLSYPIRDDIPIMLVDQAKPLGASAE